MDPFELRKLLYNRLLEREIKHQIPTPKREDAVELFQKEAMLNARIQQDVAIILQSALKIQEVGFEITLKEDTEKTG